MKRPLLLLAAAGLAAVPLQAGLRYLVISAQAPGGGAVPAVASPAVALPALPLAAGAKVVGFGHSYIDRSWATSSTVGGVQTLGRGVLPYVDALDRASARAAGVNGRFDLFVCYDDSGARWTSSAATRLSCADQGFNNDVVRLTAKANPAVPSSLSRTPYVIARHPQIVYLDIGLNDVRLGRTADQIIADLDREVSVLTSNGIWVVLQTLTYPKDGGQAFYAASVSQINDWIKAQNGRPGVKPCDTTAIDGTPSASADNFGGDMLHLSPAGARARAAVVLPLLQSMVSPSTDPATGALDVANIWPLKGFAGTSGTLTNATGQVATGYNLSRVTGASSYVGAKETISAGNDWQVVTVTPNNNGTLLHSFGLRPVAQYTYAALGLAAGDWYELSVTVQLDDWAGWTVANGDQQTASLYAEGYDSTLATAYTSYSNLSGMPGKTVRLSITGQVPSSGDRFRWTNRMILLFHRSDTGGTGVAKIGEPVLRKIANPVTKWSM